MKQSFYILYLGILFMSGCSSRIFYISAKPEGSLIRHQEYYGYSNLVEAGPDEIPYKVLFAGKKSKTSFSAMKRGYYEDTIWVTRESPQKVSFVLKKEAGAENSIDYKSQLANANLLVFPPEVDVILHKGVGNLDRYEKSDLQSKEVSRNILSLLSNEFTDSTKPSRLCITDPANPNDTLRVQEQVKNYLLSVKPDLLKYYGVPPSVNKFNNWRNLLSGLIRTGSKEDTSSFCVVVYCKTIKPTTGRIIGNATVSVASGAVSGYQSAMYGTSVIYYDPNSFSLDSSTLLMIYYIHPGSGEIVEIKQKHLSFEIIDIKNQKTFVTELIKLLSDI